MLFQEQVYPEGWVLHAGAVQRKAHWPVCSAHHLRGCKYCPWPSGSRSPNSVTWVMVTQYCDLLGHGHPIPWPTGSWSPNTVTYWVMVTQYCDLLGHGHPILWPTGSCSTNTVTYWVMVNQYRDLLGHGHLIKQLYWFLRIFMVMITIFLNVYIILFCGHVNIFGIWVASESLYSCWRNVWTLPHFIICTCFTKCTFCFIEDK